MINKNTFKFNSTGYTLTEIGDYDSSEIISMMSIKLNGQINKATFQHENRFELKFTEDVTFSTDDYFFAKVLGFEASTEYKSKVLRAPMKMFTGIARVMNVMCYFLKEPNFVQKGKK